MNDLENQVRVVAEARQIRDEVVNAKKEAQEKWATDHQAMLDEVDRISMIASNEEATLRDLTLQAYAETGNKAPAEGVGIRERVVLTYDGKVAFDWAKSHKMALQLDKRAFEKIVKADTPDFVKVSTEAIATIATELKVE